MHPQGFALGEWVLSTEGLGHPIATHFTPCSSRSLQWNFIQTQAAVALAQALQSNGSLVSLE